MKRTPVREGSAQSMRGRVDRAARIYGKELWRTLRAIQVLLMQLRHGFYGDLLAAPLLADKDAVGAHLSRKIAHRVVHIFDDRSAVDNDELLGIFSASLCKCYVARPDCEQARHRLEVGLLVLEGRHESQSDVLLIREPHRELAAHERGVGIEGDRQRRVAVRTLHRARSRPVQRSRGTRTVRVSFA